MADFLKSAERWIRGALTRDGETGELGETGHVRGRTALPDEEHARPIKSAARWLCKWPQSQSSVRRPGREDIIRKMQDVGEKSVLGYMQREG